MKKVVITFGLLAAAVLLLYHLSSYWLFIGGHSQEWLMGIVVVIAVMLGVFFGKTTSPSAASREAAAPTADYRELGISEREYEVLCLINRGRSNQEVASELFIAESTVKSHVSNLLVKLDARRRTEAVARAKDLKII